MAVDGTDEVNALAAEFLPRDRVTDAMAGVAPSFRLVTAREGPVVIGGDAPLIEGEQWPRNERGIPMTFVASIDLGALPAYPGTWPDQAWQNRSELLRIFADLAAAPYESGPATILAAPRDSTVVAVPAPPLPDPWPRASTPESAQEFDNDALAPSDRIRELRRSGARAIPALTAETDHFARKDDPAADAYASFAQAIWAPTREAYPVDSGIAKLFGAPLLVQDDPRLDAAYERHKTPDHLEWTILLEVHDGWGNIRILDGGAYCICVPTDALRDGTFEEAWCAVAGD